MTLHCLMMHRASLSVDVRSVSSSLSKAMLGEEVKGREGGRGNNFDSLSKLGEKGRSSAAAAVMSDDVRCMDASLNMHIKILQSQRDQADAAKAPLGV